jgi:hypothetical protein
MNSKHPMAARPLNPSFLPSVLVDELEPAGISIAFEPFLELGPSPLLPDWLPKSNAGSASVLLDDVDAGGLYCIRSAAPVTVDARRLTDAPRPNKGVRARGSALVGLPTESRPFSVSTVKVFNDAVA